MLEQRLKVTSTDPTALPPVAPATRGRLDTATSRPVAPPPWLTGSEWCLGQGSVGWSEPRGPKQTTVIAAPPPPTDASEAALQGPRAAGESGRPGVQRSQNNLMPTAVVRVSLLRAAKGTAVQGGHLSGPSRGSQWSLACGHCECRVHRTFRDCEPGSLPLLKNVEGLWIQKDPPARRTGTRNFPDNVKGPQTPERPHRFSTAGRKCA